MARSLWTGTISFGLVSVPVRMFSATESKELRFHFLDKRDLAPIGYDKVRRDTGEHVDNDEIVRGFEVEKGRYVPLEDEDLDRLDIELTQDDRHLRLRRPGRDRPDLLPQDLLPRASGGRREAVPAARPGARRDRQGRDRQGRDPQQAAPGSAAPVERDAPPRDDVLRGRSAAARVRRRQHEASQARGRDGEVARREPERDFDPEKYDDTYRKELLQLLRAKAKGKALPEPEPEERGRGRRPYGRPARVGRADAKQATKAAGRSARERQARRREPKLASTGASGTRRRPRSRSAASARRRSRSSSSSVTTRAGSTTTSASSATARSRAGRCRRACRSSRAAAPRRARRGPSARLRDLRGRDPEGPVRRRHGRDLGPRHLRARRGEARRRPDRPPARRAARRPLDARPGEARRQPEELAPDPQARGRRRSAGRGAGTRRCSPRSPTRRRCRAARGGSSRSSGTATGSSRCVAGGEAELRTRKDQDYTGALRQRREGAREGAEDSGLRRRRRGLRARRGGPAELLGDAAGEGGHADRLLRLRPARGGRRADGRPAAVGAARAAREAARRRNRTVQFSEAFDDGRALLRAAKERRLEGIMGKRRDSRYLPGQALARLAQVQDARRAGVRDRRLHARQGAARVVVRVARPRGPRAPTASSTPATSAPASTTPRSSGC